MNTHRKSSSATKLAKTLRTYFSPKNIFTKEDKRFRLNWREILCCIGVSVFVCWLLARVGKFDLSRPILAMLGSVFIAIRLRWQLRGRVWFWVTILIYVALSAVLTSALTWGTDGPSRPIIGGFMGVSVYCLFVVLHALERWSPPASSSSSQQLQPNQALRRHQ